MSGENPAVGMLSAAQIAGAIDGMRFDRAIESFEFKPSLGIVAKRMQMLGDEFKDMREPLKQGITDVMTISILENFVSGGRPAWDALSEDTLKRHAKEGAGMVLVRTGALAEAASSPGIWSIGAFSATIRDLPKNVWYGKVHQAGVEGNEFGGGNWFEKYKTAARKILGPEEDDEEVTKAAYKIFDQRTIKHGAAPRGTPTIPARPFAVFQEEDIDAIQLIFVTWIEAKVEEGLNF
jgi:phage gpG-like protein